MQLRTIPAAIWTAIIVVVCLTPSHWLGGGDTGDGISWLEKTLGSVLGPIPFDKVVHFGIFFVFGLAWRWARAPGMTILIGGTAFAAGTELGQAIPILERMADFDDLIANVLGLLVAVVITRSWSVRTQEPEPSPPPTP